MFEVFKYVDKFFTSLTNYLTYNDIFIIFVGLFLLTTIVVIFSTSKAYEAKLIKAIDKFNAYFIDNPQINEENLVAFNTKMKERFVPKQLRKAWQQFVLYRENKASHYMSFENCVATPIKNSSYKRDTKMMSVLSYIFAFCALILNCYYCYETADLANVLSSVLLTPVIILLLNYILQIFFSVKHSAIISDLFQNYQYFEVNVDKATETLPEYVDYEVLFDRNEIKKGIPILYAYLQKRAEEEQRELERARLKNVEHEKFNFDDAGVEASLVLERAMQEAENYIAERKKYIQDIEQINSDITQEDMNYREITKEYNRQMQVSRETFANFKAQLEEVSSTIEANYLKKQQQQELDRQRNLERDFDTATEKHKKVIETYQAELDTIDKFIAQSRNTLETAMKSEFSTYSGKVYDEVQKAVEAREKDNIKKLKSKIEELEEVLVVKNKELDEVYNKNQAMSEELEKINLQFTQPVQEVYEPEIPDQKPVQEPIQEPVQEVYEPEMLETEYAEPDYVEEYAEPEFIEEVQQPVEEYQPVEEEIQQPEYVEEFIEEVEPEDYIDPYKNRDVEEFELFNAGEDEEFVEAEIGETVEINPEFIISERHEKENLSADEENDSIEEKVVSRRGRPRKVVDETQQREKRGRGRPRKEVQEEPKQTATIKKGRGRPKKVQEESKLEEKKGRGRPRKEVQEEPKQTAAVKKGRGRPKKVQQEAKLEEKKGRGRPRKEVNLSQDLNTVAKNIDDIDEYLKQIDNAIAEENAKLEETRKELSKNAKLKRKK